MFSRLGHTDRRKISQRLGDYVSHRIVAPKWGEPRPVAELNALDRHELAREWYKTQLGNKWDIDWITSVLNRYYGDLDLLIEDIAAYIDDRIPRAYMKHYERNADAGPASYSIKPSAMSGSLPHGLRYCYRRKYNRETTDLCSSLPDNYSYHDKA